MCLRYQEIRKSGIRKHWLSSASEPLANKKHKPGNCVQQWPCQLIRMRRAASSLSQAELWLSLSWCTPNVVWMQWTGMCNDDVLVHVMECDTCSLQWLLTSCGCQPSSHNVCVHIWGLTEQHEVMIYQHSSSVTQTTKSKSDMQFTGMTDNYYSQ